MIGALAHGLPLVCLPMGADQPHNGRRCVDLGVGLVLDPVTATPAGLATAFDAVLATPSFRCAAERLRAEGDALPGPDHAVGLLEDLAGGR